MIKPSLTNKNRLSPNNLRNLRFCISLKDEAISQNSIIDGLKKRHVGTSYNKTTSRGFTIVELLVVIVVIGILAAITIVSYTGITQRAVSATLQSDLSNSSNQLKIYYTLNGSYPTALNGSYCPTSPIADNNLCLKPTPGNTIVYSSNGTTFSLTETNTNNGAAYAVTENTAPTLSVAPGQVAYTTSGTYSWTAPVGVTSVSVVAVGGGGGGGYSWSYSGGSGGGLGWKNNITVTPGQSYTVVIGAGGNYSSAPAYGNNSYFIDLSTVAGYGAGQGGTGSSGSGTQYGGGYTGGGGGRGGNNNNNQWSNTGSGAAGYSGNGGDGSNTAGTGGGGGSGYAYSSTYGSAAGGGVGLLGQGANGAGGTTSTCGQEGGRGGSGGANGADGEPCSSTSSIGTITGGAYGGGGGGGGTSTGGGKGGGGAVRIIWGGGRSFPSTNTADM